jgi:hypothetical protein
MNIKEYVMNPVYLLLLYSALFLLCSCTIFYDKQTASAPEMQAPKPLSVPIGKQWQLVEEPPQLSDDSGRLPFQKEQSVQPGVARPTAPDDKRRIDTTH